jgi:dipeptidyl aminopeptidase/acylaminoacyl peptidase
LTTFSDDATRVAFVTYVSSDSLVVAQADGTPIRTLIGGQNGSNGPIDGDVYGDPLLSPSGDRVAFVASSGGPYYQGSQQAAQTYELRVLDVASGTVTSLASATGISVSLIRFSPEGDRILFSKTDANDATSLWSVQADGSGTQLLVPGNSTGASRAGRQRLPNPG